MFINKPSAEDYHRYKNVIDMLNGWFFGRGLDETHMIDFGSENGSLVVAVANSAFLKNRYYFSGVLVRVRQDRVENGFGFVFEDHPFLSAMDPLTDVQVGAEIIKIFCEDLEIEPRHSEKDREVEREPVAV